MTHRLPMPDPRAQSVLPALRNNSGVEAPCKVCKALNCSKSELPNLSTFVITDGAWNNTRAIVPCDARVYFNSLVGGQFEMVSARGLHYTIELEKDASRTVLRDGWPDFVDDHELCKGDSVVMIYQETMKSFQCIAVAQSGEERCPVMSEEEIEEERMHRCLYTARMKVLTCGEQDKVIAVLYKLPRNTLRPIIHRMTKTNVMHNRLKISKNLVRLLCLDHEGTVVMKLQPDGDEYEVEYSVSTDGRAALCWGDVVDVHRPRVGCVMMLVPSFRADSVVLSTYFP